MVELKLKFPNNFFEEENRCGYMVSKHMKEVWAVELDLLAELTRVCNENNITFYADGGTLLGAIRHNGFIPWDDDIDVAMLRKDYEKLLSVSHEFKEPYFLQSWQTESEMYYSGHAQLRNSNTAAILSSSLPNKHKFNQGIFIDIFVLDAVPDNQDTLTKEKNKVNLYNKLINTKLYYYDKNIIKRILKTILRIFINADIVYKKKETLIKSIEIEKNKYIAPLSFYFETTFMKRDKKIYNKSIIMKFENIEVPCPDDFDLFLKERYGHNYMTPIKESTGHGKVLFDVNTSYKKYI